MNIHASPTALPELDAFLSMFNVRFRRSEGEAALECKFYWSNLPAKATLAELVEYAHRRHAIEPFHEEAKLVRLLLSARST